MNEIFKTAVDKAAEASEKMAVALQSNVKDSTQSAVDLVKTGTDVSKEAISRGVEATDEIKATGDATSQTFSKSGNKK